METEKMSCGCGAHVFWFTRKRAAQLRKDKEMDEEERNTETKALIYRAVQRLKAS